MIRLLPLIPISALASAPVFLLPTPAFAAVAAVAAVLLAVGALIRLRVLVTAGASVTLVQYAAALAVTDAPPSAGGAAAVGVALVLVLDVSDFARRFRDASLAPGAWLAQIRHWAATAALGALASLALAAAPALIRLGGSPALYPFLAAAGALAAAAGIAGAVWQRHRDALPEDTRDA